MGEQERKLMEDCRFSIIVVCLNAGDKLEQTVGSIWKQTYENYEIIVKDGGSTDGSIEALFGQEKDQKRLKLIKEADGGIYEAMNQAILHAAGDYVLFLNCGDSFPDADILEKTAAFIRKQPGCGIYYGDTFCERTNTGVASPPHITPFVCYRNIPCHQSCFYGRELFSQKQYDPSYRIRADYDHFLWCVFKGGAEPAYMGFVTASYEGGGYSESKANQKRDKEEHRKITRTYFSRGQLFRYQLAMACTLAPLRRFLAEKTLLSGLYQKLKARIYR